MAQGYGLQKYGMPIEEWEAKNHKEPEDGIYAGNTRAKLVCSGMSCAVGESGILRGVSQFGFALKRTSFPPLVLAVLAFNSIDVIDKGGLIIAHEKER